jgi:ABC-type bacteriocin/lantibiotic exporter with double-glycine peptidase domain
MLLAFQGYLTLFTATVNLFIRTGQTINEMRTNMERIEDVMSYKPDVTNDESLISDDADFDKLSGNIEMKNITFGYSPLGEPLLKDFSISIKGGQRIALVGSSGCGKSTVSKLVSGMYRPWSGELLYDGKPIDEIDRAAFTSSLAVVDQDIILFADSISNNIKMWDNSIEDFEMIIAARDARLHEDIMRREGGYQYKMNEGGSDFSGGQRQRMEIARALAADPTIVILDEATSALDAKTEYETVQHIKDRGITCIVIAHRLSTIRDCDEIIVMDKGRIAERGTHDELLEKSGLYSQLVSTE